MTRLTRPPLLVFTDLDGTLLDHDTYDWRPARPAIKQVLELGGGVVLATSKTAAEVVVLRRDMGLTDWPAIVENGAGVLAAARDKAATSPDYAALRAAIADISSRFNAPFHGFGDMNVAEVMAATGLSKHAAERAKTRSFSEPGTWTGDDETRAAFVGALADMGITARMGGRFLTLSYGRTKADAMAEVIADYAPEHTIALGDAPNDTEMLVAAEIGIIIPNPHATPLPKLPGEAAGTIRRAAAPGPVGWNLSVAQIMDDLDLSQKDTGHG